jgi:hypothetical protein
VNSTEVHVDFVHGDPQVIRPYMYYAHAHLSH